MDDEMLNWWLHLMTAQIFWWAAIGTIVSMLIGYSIGKAKGHPVGGCVLALLFGPLGWIFAAIWGSSVRKCPSCAEPVQREAKICRYCSAPLTPLPTESGCGTAFALLFGIVVIVAVVWFCVRFASDSSEKTNRSDTSSSESQEAAGVSREPTSIPVSEPSSFAKGDHVTLVASCPLRFHDTFYRQGSAGEVFEVADYRPDTHRVYVLSEDVAGNSIALNVDEQNVCLSAPSP